MPRNGRVLALAFGTAVAFGLGASALAIARRGPFAPVPPPAPPQLTADERRARNEQQQAEVFGDLCARVDAQPAQRPFDSALLRPRPSVTAEQELAALQQELAAAETQFREGWPWQCWRHSEVLAERLAIFPWRFGQDPRTLDGWAPLAAAARRMVADFEHDPPELELNEEDSYAGLFRAQLLELAGRTDEADVALAKVKANSWCGNCAVERQGVVRMRRSEFAERRGNLPTALVLLEDHAVSPFGNALLTSNDDIALARLGLLLLQTGRDADGRCVLQLVAELQPGTPGGEVAHAALEQMGALREPTLERLQQVWIVGAEDNDPYRRAAVEAFAFLPIGDRFERLAALHEQGDKAALAGLIALRDVRARPILESVLAEGDLTFAESALRGLAALDGGAGGSLRPALERLSQPQAEWAYVNLGSLNEFLHGTCGGGPVLAGDARTKDEDFARAWIDWLDQTGWQGGR